MGANIPQDITDVYYIIYIREDMANLDPRDMVGKIYVGDH